MTATAAMAIITAIPSPEPQRSQTLQTPQTPSHYHHPQPTIAAATSAIPLSTPIKGIKKKMAKNRSAHNLFHNKQSADPPRNHLSRSPLWFPQWLQQQQTRGQAFGTDTLTSALPLSYLKKKTWVFWSWHAKNKHIH